mgnify:CR=1 FL=1
MEENKKTELAQAVAAQIHPLLILREIIQKFIVVIMVAITAMSCAYVASDYMYKPQYQTKTTFVVSVKNGSASVYSNLAAAKDTASSFAQILSSDVMKKQIAQELGVGRINGEIKTEIISETNILELRITASTPYEAYRITTTLLDSYEPLTETALNNVVLDILQYPSVPTAPINHHSVKKPIILAGLIGAAVSAALLGVMAYMRDTVKTAEEAETKLDIKSLGTIRYENKYKTFKSKLKHKKTSILITNPTTGFDYVETFKKLRTRIDYNLRKNNCKTLMVTSTGEDEGKSTVSVNIALAMRKKYDKVLLIDADMKKSAMHKILDYGKESYFTLNDLLEGKSDLKETLIKDEKTGLYILFARNSGEHSTDLVTSPRMRELISQAKKIMDIVVIDTPPMAVSPDAECIAEVVDASVLVVRQDKIPVKVINDMIDVLNASHAKLLGCILNNFRSADFNDNFSYGQSEYGYGKYGYGKYGYGKYGYGKYGYGNNDSGKASGKRAEYSEEEM